MKVVCPYCDSYIEADENMNCPNCGGSVSAEVKETEDLLREEEARRLNIDDRFVKKLPPDGTRVRVRVVRKFITAIEVLS